MWNQKVRTHLSITHQATLCPPNPKNDLFSTSIHKTHRLANCLKTMQSTEFPEHSTATASSQTNGRPFTFVGFPLAIRRSALRQILCTVMYPILTVASKFEIQHRFVEESLSEVGCHDPKCPRAWPVWWGMYVKATFHVLARPCSAYGGRSCPICVPPYN